MRCRCHDLPLDECPEQLARTIRVRHELSEHSTALLRALGFRYIVDPEAPECEHYSGRRMRRVACRRCRAAAE